MNRGALITDIRQAVQAVIVDHRPLYHDKTLLGPSQVRTWSLALLAEKVSAGKLYLAPGPIDNHDGGNVHRWLQLEALLTEFSDDDIELFTNGWETYE